MTIPAREVLARFRNDALRLADDLAPYLEEDTSEAPSEAQQASQKLPHFPTDFRALVLVDAEVARPQLIWVNTRDEAGAWSYEDVSRWRPVVGAKFAATAERGGRIPQPGAYILEGKASDGRVEGKFHPLRDFLGWLALGRDVNLSEAGEERPRGVSVGGHLLSLELVQGFWRVHNARNGWLFDTKDFPMALFVYLQAVEEEVSRTGGPI